MEHTTQQPHISMPLFRPTKANKGKSRKNHCWAKAKVDSAVASILYCSFNASNSGRYLVFWSTSSKESLRNIKLTNWVAHSFDGWGKKTLSPPRYFLLQTVLPRWQHRGYQSIFAGFRWICSALYLTLSLQLKSEWDLRLCFVLSHRQIGDILHEMKIYMQTYQLFNVIMKSLRPQSKQSTVPVFFIRISK